MGSNESTSNLDKRDVSIASRPAILTSEVLGLDMVIVHVGKEHENQPFTFGKDRAAWNFGEEKKFIIHKKLLCDRSDFFAKALNDNFSEGAKGKMTLPEDDPEVFAIFVDYLYRGQVLGAEDSSWRSRQLHANRMRSAYFLAEKLCIKEFMNILMDGFREIDQNFYPVHSHMMDETRNIYTTTHENSQLRRFWSAHAAWKITPEGANQNYLHAVVKLTKEVPDFGADVISAQFKYKNIFTGKVFKSPFAKGGQVGDCEFHVHDAGPDCSTSATEPASGTVHSTYSKASPPSVRGRFSVFESTKRFGEMFPEVLIPSSPELSSETKIFSLNLLLANAECLGLQFLQGHTQRFLMRTR